jgi:hypothetical protein
MTNNNSADQLKNDFEGFQDKGKLTKEEQAALDIYRK